MRASPPAIRTILYIRSRFPPTSQLRAKPDEGWTDIKKHILRTHNAKLKKGKTLQTHHIDDVNVLNTTCGVSWGWCRAAFQYIFFNLRHDGERLTHTYTQTHNSQGTHNDRDTRKTD